MSSPFVHQPACYGFRLPGSTAAPLTSLKEIVANRFRFYQDWLLFVVWISFASFEMPHSAQLRLLVSSLEFRRWAPPF